MNLSYLVVDTNTVLAAICFPTSIARRFLNFMIEHEEFKMLVSADTLVELWQVIEREKFDRYIPYEERKSALDAYLEHSAMIEHAVNIVECRDPTDDKFLELAVAGNANLIITRDNDLLVLNPFRGIEIIDAETFLTRFAEDA